MPEIDGPRDGQLETFTIHGWGAGLTQLSRKLPDEPSPTSVEDPFDAPPFPLSDKTVRQADGVRA